jgi:hypothetical protein
MEYYIPVKDGELVEWSGNLIGVSKANIAEWDLPEARLAAIEAVHGRFKTLYEKCQTPDHTPLDTLAKNEAKADLVKKEQDFVRFHLQNNEKMTDTGREALRIPIR